ncbi:MAG: hypothetical protein ACRDPY_16260 [Streptosporangiaceae bacterium]
MTPYVVLPLDDYLALRDAAQRPPERPTPPSGGLAAAIALLTAKAAGLPATPTTVAPDTDPAAVIRALVLVTSALLNTTTPDRGANLLQALGLAAQDGT